MHIAYTDEQEALRSELSAYYDKLLTDDVREALAVEHGCGPVNRAMVKQMAADGWLGIFFSPEHSADMLDAVRAAAEAPGIRRIRLGSLEPVIATEEFVTELSKISKLCPQFHLSLQSGSDRVLKSMRRRYTGSSVCPPII